MSNQDGTPNHEAIAAFFEKYPEKAEQLARWATTRRSRPRPRPTPPSAPPAGLDRLGDGAHHGAARRRTPSASAGRPTRPSGTHGRTRSTLPRRAGAPGTLGRDPLRAHRAPRSRACPGIGFTHVTMYELDDPDVRPRPIAALAVDDALRTDGRMHTAHVDDRRRRVRGPRPATGAKPEPSEHVAGPHPHPGVVQRPRAAKPSGTPGTTSSTCPTCSRVARSVPCRGGGAFPVGRTAPTSSPSTTSRPTRSTRPSSGRRWCSPRSWPPVASTRRTPARSR